MDVAYVIKMQYGNLTSMGQQNLRGKFWNKWEKSHMFYVVIKCIPISSLPLGI